MDSLREPLNRIVPGGEGDSEVRASPSMEGSPTKKEVDEEGPPEGLHEGDMERWVEMVQNASSYTPLSSFLETFDGLKGFFSVVLLVLPPLLATWMRTSGNDIIPEWLVLYSFISFALAGPTIFICKALCISLCPLPQTHAHTPLHNPAAEFELRISTWWKIYPPHHSHTLQLSSHCTSFFTQWNRMI